MKLNTSPRQYQVFFSTTYYMSTKLYFKYNDKTIHHRNNIPSLTRTCTLYTSYHRPIVPMMKLGLKHNYQELQTSQYHRQNRPHISLHRDIYIYIGRPSRQHPFLLWLHNFRCVCLPSRDSLMLAAYVKLKL